MCVNSLVGAENVGGTIDPWPEEEREIGEGGGWLEKVNSINQTGITTKKKKKTGRRKRPRLFLHFSPPSSEVESLNKNTEL